MKTKLILLSVLLTTTLLTAQPAATIICPPDREVHNFDLDLDYDTYGQPTVNANAPFTLEKTITVFDNSCTEKYTLLNYKVFDQNTNVEMASCTQRITIKLAVLTDVIFPQDIDLASGNFEDTSPEVTGYPEPWEFINGGSSIYAAYSDQRFQMTSNSLAKVLRTWTLLDWCSGNVLTQVQIIKILDFQNESSNNTRLTVENCKGEKFNLEIQGIDVSTTQAGFVLDLSNCTLENGELLSYVNCISEHNAIDNNESIIIGINGPDDDYLNGVSTLDMVLSQKHILGIDPFDNKCKILAADINNNGSITAFDLLEMRKLILGIHSVFPNNTSWQFHNRNIIDPNISSLSLTDLTFKKSEFPLQELRLLALKTGDVNGTAVGN